MYDAVNNSLGPRLFLFMAWLWKILYAHVLMSWSLAGVALIRKFWKLQKMVLVEREGVYWETTSRPRSCPRPSLCVLLCCVPILKWILLLATCWHSFYVQFYIKQEVMKPEKHGLKLTKSQSQINRSLWQLNFLHIYNGGKIQANKVLRNYTQLKNCNCPELF